MHPECVSGDRPSDHEIAQAHLLGVWLWQWQWHDFPAVWHKRWTIFVGDEDFFSDGADFDTPQQALDAYITARERGLIGIYHHASPKHLPRYVDEFSFRLNEGNVKHHTMTRLDSFVKGTAGKRLTYKGLIQ